MLSQSLVTTPVATTFDSLWAWYNSPEQIAVRAAREAIALDLIAGAVETGLELPYDLSTIVDLEQSGFVVDLTTGVIAHE